MSFSSRRRQHFRYATLNIPAGFEVMRAHDHAPTQLFASVPVRGRIETNKIGEPIGTHWLVSYDHYAYLISNNDVEKHHMIESS